MFSFCCGELTWSEFNITPCYAFLGVFRGDQPRVAGLPSSTNPPRAPTQPHQVLKHNLGLQPPAAQHSSVQRNGEFVVASCSQSTVKSWQEGTKPGSVPLEARHSTNIGRTSECKTEMPSLSCLFQLQTSKVSCLGLNIYWFYRLLLSKEM